MSLCISFICAVFYSCCKLFNKNKDFQIASDDAVAFFISIVIYFIFFYGFYYILSNKINIFRVVNRIVTLFYLKLKEAPLCVSSITISVMWLPYFIAYSPGTAMWDTYAVLNNMFYSIKTAHHPIFINFLMQNVVKLGNIIFNIDGAGMFLYIVVQYILCSCAIGYLISYLVKFVCKKWLIITTITYFGILTIWPSYAMTMVKDTGFYAFFL